MFSCADKEKTIVFSLKSFFTNPTNYTRNIIHPQTELIILGGGGRIRTHGGLTPTTVFKTAAFNRSATPPKFL